MPGKDKSKRGSDRGGGGRGGRGGGQRFWRCEICRSSEHATIECDKFRCHECGDQGHHARHCEKRRCFFCNESGHKRSECPTRASRLSVGERAGTSGSSRGRKRDDSELSESSEASPEQRVRVESAAPSTAPRRQPSGSSGGRGASYSSVTSGRRATGLDTTVQTMLSVAASAGVRANQQPDYNRQLSNVEGELERLERDYQARRAALMEERATISRNRDMYESLQHLVAGLSDWYGSFTTSVATSGTASVSMAQSNPTDPAVTASLELAVSSTASVSQPAVGPTVTPAVVTHTVSSNTPRVSATEVPPANGENSVSASAPPGAQASEENSVVPFPEVRVTPGEVLGAPAAQQISDSLRVGDASLEDLLLSETEEVMETGDNNNDPAGDGDDPNLDNQE